MENIDIPTHFLCPISLQLMKDPVTLSTGITYDREAIETWLFSFKNHTCPVTKQVLTDLIITPNHTLRRLIQSWCTLNASNGVERIPTPKPIIEKSHIIKILAEANKSDKSQLKCLQKLKSIALQNERNRILLHQSGAVDFLKSVIKSSSDSVSEALSVLHLLNDNITIDNEFVNSLIRVMETESYQSRAYAITLLKSTYESADPIQLMNVGPELFVETVRVLRDKISQQSSKAALKLLIELCPWGRNRIKAVEAGAVTTLIDLLLDEKEKRSCELILKVLDQVCRCAEGRAEVLGHGAGVAVVSKKILRVSQVASDRAVRILSLICTFSGGSRKVGQEMLQVGAVSKLCLVLQADGSLKTKEKARDVLRVYSRVWRDSGCIPAHLLSAYPSS